MPPIRILVFSAATFLMLCVAVTPQTPTSELEEADLKSVPLNKKLVVQQKRNSNNYLNCSENRKPCKNNFENLEFGRCSFQSWPGWIHEKSEEPLGNISALFYEPIGPDGKPTITSGSKEQPWPNGSPGQNGYPSTGKYPWPNGLVDLDFAPDPNPYPTAGKERWFKFGDTHFDDHLVAQDQKWWAFNEIRDAFITIQYPLNGYDEKTVVSYCLLIVTSENELTTTAYIIGGGIGQSFIEINIYVYATTLFGFAAQIYAFQ